MLLRREARALIEKTMENLPPSQRAVVTLRDVEGLDAAEVCNILDVSEANQRVLLHRGRSKVRAALERYLARA
jgi:RNA polymerase sigma-70 factor (ECF subfamily)